MTRLLIIVLGFVLFNCQSAPSNSEEENSTTEQQEPQPQSAVTTLDPEVALAFINSYVEYNMNFDIEMSMEEWVNAQANVSEGFKTELARMISEAKKEDPELGLGFDPIFNAQEFPEEGFVLDAVDGEYVVVKAKGAGWEGFKVAIKLANEEGKSLVDGAGVVNIPEERISGQ